ncbi:hypothetical protein [Lysobacter capsici]|uniref:hypothetical protein n=1 Tax=Lysobacter capsici TaxID=435897 RepID=UPI00128C41EA|nr:hypothetical protein [Lysobacter capsici]
MAAEGAAGELLPSKEEGTIDGAPPLIPPGEYRLKFETWATVMMFGRSPKLVLTFKVIDFGAHFETKLKRWYNVRRLRGKAGKHGQFSAGWSSDVVREYGRLIGLPQRTDRIAISAYGGRVIVGKVGTVNKDRTQQALPTGLEYSVIQTLLRTEQ